MASKFGFQVTVQDRTIWIFPEDIDAAAVAAQAEAALTKVLQEKVAELEKVADGELTKKINALPPELKTAVNQEIASLEADGIQTITAKATALANRATSELNALKAKANAGIAYSWTRGAGEDPIQLGTLSDLVRFIQVSIIESLPAIIRPSFNAEDQFKALVGSFPDPINGAVDAFATKAIFELDGLRLKIPGKGSTEKTQFEVVMLINLLALELKLGPFQINRLYAKLGNFEPPAPALAATVKV